MRLFEYQREGAQFLAERPRALLADKMGLGKTVQAIEACNIVQAERVLVVAPAIARINWHREFDTWAFYGPEVRVYSFEKFASDKKLREELAAWAPDVWIIDEAHYLKTRDSKRTVAAYGKWCRGETPLLKACRHVWVMSGTFAPNNVTELYPHMRALFPQTLPGTGSFADFMVAYTNFRRTDWGVKVMGSKNVPELKKALAPYWLRRTPEQVLKDLPDVLIGRVALDEAEAARAVRAELESLGDTPEVQELLHRLEADAPVPEADPHVASFRRVCGVAKAGPCADMVKQQLDSGDVEKIVLFAYHREVIRLLTEELLPFGPVVVQGGDTEAERQAAIDTFQKDPTARVFIGQITACATAVTLTAAHHALFVESSWVPSDDEQAIYRLRRIGQKRQVVVQYAYLAGSIDEALSKTIARKVQDLLPLYMDERPHHKENA